MRWVGEVCAKDLWKTTDVSYTVLLTGGKRVNNGKGHSRSLHHPLLPTHSLLSSPCTSRTIRTDSLDYSRPAPNYTLTAMYPPIAAAAAPITVSPPPALYSATSTGCACSPCIQIASEASMAAAERAIDAASLDGIHHCWDLSLSR